jgi:hypothetical protein
MSQGDPDMTRLPAVHSDAWADEVGAASFPASDPPASWTWDVPPAEPPAADAAATPLASTAASETI